MDEIFSLGQWIKRRRRARDLTQDELARQIGCSKELIAKIEADARRPSKQIAERLAAQLGLAADERAIFLQAARAQLGVDRLARPIGSVSQPALAPAALPHGTVTFLFTDIEGSAQLWAHHAQPMGAAVVRHEALLREAVEIAGGVVFKTVGDAVYAAFASALAALTAAVAGQRALRTQPWTIPSPLQVRMALHTGVVESRGGDYVGLPVHRGARLLAAAHGGQILLSLAMAELVRELLPPDVTLRDLGRHRLKDLSHPEQIFQLVCADLPADFPPLQTLSAHGTNLPIQSTPLIGREREIADVTTLLRRADVRLVTLTGPGGAGKTRLALQAAAELLSEFTHGAYFVDLAPISDPDVVATAIAHTLGVKESGSRPLLNDLKAFLQERQLLLLLDNFEQVLDAAVLIAALRADARGLKVLITSRTVLHLSGEYEYIVPPLALPDRAHMPPPEVLTQYAAVELFIARAQAVQSSFAMTAASAPAIAEICVRLDGLPLAIELAAARIKLFPPEALLGRLARGGLAMLTGGPRDLPARQQTLRATIAWSYNLLDEGEQRLFARLGIFVGGWTIEAAEVVCGTWDNTALTPNPQPLSPILDGLAALVDQSLVRQGTGPDSEPRFTMLETIREYALERLEESGEVATLRRQHATYYCMLAEHAMLELAGEALAIWLKRLDAEDANLRAALDWSHTATSDIDVDMDLRLAGALWKFWERRGPVSQGRAHLATALARSPAPTAARASALNAAGSLACLQGDFATALPLYEEGMAIYRRLENQSGIATALFNVGRLFDQQQDYARAIPLLEESLAIVQRLGDQASIARSLFVLAELRWVQNQRSQTEAALEQALAIYRKLDDKEQILPSLCYLSFNVWLRGDYARATALASECLTLAQEVGAKDWIVHSLIHLGQIAWLQSDHVRATAVHSETLALAHEMEHTTFIAMSLRNLGADVWAQGDYARATALYQESLPLYKTWGDKWGIAECIEGLGWSACSQGQATSDGILYLRAARLLGAAAVLRETTGKPMAPNYYAVNARVIAETRAQLDETTFAVAWAEGQAMTLEQAIEYALGNDALEN